MIGTIAAKKVQLSLKSDLFKDVNDTHDSVSTEVNSELRNFEIGIQKRFTSLFTFIYNSHAEEFIV